MHYSAWLLAVFAVSALATGAANADRELAPLEGAFRSSEFKLVYRRSDLPQQLRTFFVSQATSDHAELDDLLANPGEDFNSGCVQEHGVPPSRLVFAGTSEDVFFALFERGGRSHSLHLVLLGDGTLSRAECRYSFPLEFIGISQLKNRIAESQRECR